jgi:hypothetical protein
MVDAMSPTALLKLAPVLVGGLVLSGCMTYAPSERFIGMPREQVIAELGSPRPAPTSLDSARRLDFPRGPRGKHTYAIEFDDAGKVIGYRQLLTEKNFGFIIPGMDVQAVIDHIGVSTDTFVLGRGRGYVWNYRYENPICRWFQIEFTAEDKVRSAGYGLPPECRPRFAVMR